MNDNKIELNLTASRLKLYRRIEALLGADSLPESINIAMQFTEAMLDAASQGFPRIQVVSRDGEIYRELKLSLVNSAASLRGTK